MRFPVVALIVALLAAALFIPGLHGDFILDDSVTILRNYVLYVNELHVDELIYAALSFHHGHGERALPMLSFAIDYWRMGAMDATAFKATNILIHAITTFFLALFCRRLLLLAKWNPQHAAWGALAITLIWAIHPLQVSSVLYIVQRMQTMATLFIVLSLWSYLLMRQHQIEGGRGRIQAVGVIVFWFFGLMCKEDAVLLPLYTLLLELTVLRFQAGKAVMVRGLKQCYALFVLLAVLVYVFLVIPRLSCWGEVCLPRDFNSGERLLTQGRVLVMYLGQIVLPLSDRLPFIYDNYAISRSLWQPWTTLPSMLIVIGLIVWAWCLRHIRPVFAFGVLLFFAGHFVSSNVILLEMVFEHRNHFPLIGAVLALTDLVLWVCQRLRLGRRVIAIVFIMVVLLLAASTLYQTYIWGDSGRLGQKMTKLVPASTRAWNQYATVYFGRYNLTKNPEHLVRAVAVMEDALKYISSPLFVSNIIIYKSILGTSQEQDWQRYYQSLNGVANDRDKYQSFYYLLDNYLRGYAIDEEKLLESIEILKKQGVVDSKEYLEVANKVYSSKRRDKAIVFFRVFVEKSPADEPMVQELIEALVAGGRTEWANELKKVRQRN